MVFMDVWYVYILECSDGTYYTGITNDLDKRLAKHNAGRGARYTRTRRPVKMLWHEKVGEKSSAMKREIQIKKMARSQKEKLIAGH